MLVGAEHTLKHVTATQ